MKEEHSIRIGHSMAEVASALDQAESWLVGRNASQAVRSFVGLAIEELATNWIKYGCSDVGPHFMTFHLQLGEGRVLLQSRDDGRPFNPLDFPEHPPSTPVEERESGGLGILLLRKLADHMSYEHLDGCNILTLEKACPTSDHEQT
ncbi:MAG: ATP-binding protein [Spartobacteria bacterium]